MCTELRSRFWHVGGQAGGPWVNVLGVLPTGANGPGRGHGRLPSGTPSQVPAGASPHLPSFWGCPRCACCSLSSGGPASSPRSLAVAHRHAESRGRAREQGASRSWARRARLARLPVPSSRRRAERVAGPPRPGRGSRSLEDDVGHKPCDPGEGFTWSQCFTPSSAERR